MSLRARVVALIGAVLLVSMLMGTLVAGYQAREALRAELAAGLGGARQTVNPAFEDLPYSGHPARDLRQLVATFDGNRHVRATLLTADGRPASVSRTEAPDAAAPRWFQRLLGPSPAAIAIRTPATAPGFRAIVLPPLDEIGPHLFAVNMDAEMIAQLSDAGRYAAIPGQVRAIQSAVGHMQRQVRELLGRLRPTRVTEFGLNAAIEDLVRFWAVRRPEIAFSVSLLEDETRVPEATADVVYRIVQDAANNPLPHPHPPPTRPALHL